MNEVDACYEPDVGNGERLHLYDVACSVCRKHIGYIGVRDCISPDGVRINSVLSGEVLASFICDKCKKEKNGEDYE